MNILDTLDSILMDWTSPRVRRLIHSVLLIFTTVLTVLLTVDGDWRDALIALVAVLYTASNRSNTPEITVPAGLDDQYIEDVDDAFADVE